MQQAHPVCRRSHQIADKDKNGTRIFADWADARGLIVLDPRSSVESAPIRVLFVSSSAKSPIRAGALRVPATELPGAPGSLFSATRAAIVNRSSHNTFPCGSAVACADLNLGRRKVPLRSEVTANLPFDDGPPPTQFLSRIMSRQKCRRDAEIRRNSLFHKELKTATFCRQKSLRRQSRQTTN